ncbi:retrotransposon ty1-copia subclass [Plasmopara halstedii]|uniref:Retrotransposon ty1-copia subclass n=1 Tax=Plasmopara halstedii TaxID=4781 RepID=A0A0P1AG96_PLAHL|nr:retrotransposon ty1-copia subclass [Plasmopara halstedii]CEG39665.1 retrotransposon ty1-copia subclass [Plasmopara halstedii]|eukprot:XP_024576034.1 retrotransposon ty1-copia subclass [Plasmopara halstedii]
MASTYSPVANIYSIQTILAVCAECDYQMDQLDVGTAFLNSVLTDNAFMETPLGVNNDQGYICQQNKAIYGLKQSTRAWNKRIHCVFVRHCFKNCGADPCVYFKSTNKGLVYVGLYVDDMIIAASTSKEINQVKGVLKNAFKMKELGKTEFILGMDHDRSAGTLMIKQTRYIGDVVKRSGKQNAKSVDNPWASLLKLLPKQTPTTEEERSGMQFKPNRLLIGYLLYITACTGRDIAYVVTQL